MESEIVKNAAAKTLAYLDEHGWLQNKYKDQEGRCCLFEAIVRALISTDEQYCLREAIYNHLEYEGIVSYNDAPERTYSEVRELLMSLGE